MTSEFSVDGGKAMRVFIALMGAFVFAIKAHAAESIGVSLERMLAAKRAERADRPVTIPRSILLSVESKELHRTYDVHVKLPASYAAVRKSLTQYPVLYMNDATYNFQVAAGITHLPMNAGTIEELILVAIGYAHGDSGDDSRTRDYTPTKNPAFKQATGEASAYLRFIEREVIPSIESRFRADPKRRAYAGHSFGGLFGAYVLLTKPKLFRYYILSSPSFWYHAHVVNQLDRTYAGLNRDLDARVYVAIGELERPRDGKGRHDMVQDVRDIAAKLATHRYPRLELRTSVLSGLNHETAFPAALMNGLLWHFARDKTLPFGY